MRKLSASAIGSVFIFQLKFIYSTLTRRFDAFNELNPGKTASVCIVSSNEWKNSTLEPLCDPDIGMDVYLHTLYIGLACIPGSIIVPLLIHKLGAKFFLSEFDLSFVYKLQYM